MVSGLSRFQVEKLESFYNFFDSERKDTIGFDNLDGFMKVYLKYTGWRRTRTKANECYEIPTHSSRCLLRRSHTTVKVKFISTTGCHWGNIYYPGCMGRHISRMAPTSAKITFPDHRQKGRWLARCRGIGIVLHKYSRSPPEPAKVDVKRAIRPE
ncbi:hypothetical protein ScPMuIL_003187 [Solemya velum]